MKTKLLPLFVLLSLAAQAQQPTEKLKPFVVFIESFDQSKEKIETGSGILLGYQGKTLYMLTALHVVYDINAGANARLVEVGFHPGKRIPKTPAKVLFTDPVLDLALLSVELSGDMPVFKEVLCLGEGAYLDPRESVIIIGHTYETPWAVTERNEIRARALMDLEGNPTGMFSTTANDVFPGNSGGPVFDSEYRLVGLVTQIGSLEAQAIKIQVLRNKLKQWGNFPETFFQVCTDPEHMRFIPGGTYEQGSGLPSANADERPLRQVKINDFWMDRYEVTNEEFCQFLNEITDIKQKGYRWWYDSDFTKIKKRKGIYHPEPGFEKCPVVSVTWYGARDFAKWANKRLPTEAEWEFAARGGNQSKGYLYAGSNQPQEVAAFNQRKQLYPDAVGKLQPNELGLYDLSGNVLEWCADGYGRYLQGPLFNPQGNADEKYKVMRGGSWIHEAADIRSTRRFKSKPKETGNNVGFRCVRDALKG